MSQHGRVLTHVRAHVEHAIDLERRKKLSQMILLEQDRELVAIDERQSGELVDGSADHFTARFGTAG
jgi:hypothetical protein